ncbi:hypothetical protein Tco_1035646, partial [Tanacetum coccineum]
DSPNNFFEASHVRLIYPVQLELLIGTDDPKRKPKTNKFKHGMEKTKKRTKS